MSIIQEFIRNSQYLVLNSSQYANINPKAKVWIHDGPVDSLNLPGLDFLQIGPDPLVLEGSRKTILKFRPVVMFEQTAPFETLKGLGYTTFTHIADGKYITVD